MSVPAPPSSTISRRRTTRRALPTIGAALALGVLSTTTAAAATPDLESRATPAGPAAQTAWTKGRNVYAGDASRVGSGRLVARLSAKSTRNGGLVLSRDGRYLVVIASDGPWLVPVAAGGKPTRLAEAPSQDTSSIRWAPDSRQLLIVAGGQVTHCTVELPSKCAGAVVTRAVDEFGASWSPDSTRFAYIRSRGTIDQSELGDLVTFDLAGDGGTRVVQRLVKTKRSVTYPVPPVWTRAGLTWSSYTQTLRGDEPRRVRTRILQADGHIHTLNAATTFKGKTILPFLAAAETPSGQLLGVTFTQPSAHAYDVSLQTLSPTGVLAPYGVSFRLPEDGYSTLGVLADGRVAVTKALDDEGKRQALFLVAPGQSGLGTSVVSATSVTAAVAFPDETRGF